jgi:rare lipoprotein A
VNPVKICIITLLMIGMLVGCSSTARFSPAHDRTDEPAVTTVPKKRTAVPAENRKPPAGKKDTAGVNTAHASLLPLPDVLERPPRFRQTGTASYYARKFHGRRTASGERYDMYELTAAHPRLPFGTTVKVTNLSNKRTVTVRINDRGPHTKKRVIDLSFAAAKRIGLVGSGTARVLVEVVR